jgi:hypothetical protein
MARAARWAWAWAWVAALLLCGAAQVVHPAMFDQTVELSGGGDGTADESGRLKSLLYWALENTDSEAVRERAAAAAAGFGASAAGDAGSGDPAEPEALRLQRQRVAELADALAAVPSDEALMREMGALLAAGATAAPDVQLLALQNLSDFVALIDNAARLRPQGTLTHLADLLADRSAPRLQAAAAHVLGVAAANNPVVQSDVVEAAPQLFGLLVQVLEGHDGGAAAKALYALSALSRNAGASADAFAASGGPAALHRLLSGGRPGTPARLHRRGLALLSDLYEQGTALPGLVPSDWAPHVLRLAAQGAAEGDADMLEKGLLALQQLAAADGGLAGDPELAEGVARACAALPPDGDGFDARACAALQQRLLGSARVAGRSGEL